MLCSLWEDIDSLTFTLHHSDGTQKADGSNSDHQSDSETNQSSEPELEELDLDTTRPQQVEESGCGLERELDAHVERDTSDGHLQDEGSEDNEVDLGVSVSNFEDIEMPDSLHNNVSLLSQEYLQIDTYTILKFETATTAIGLAAVAESEMDAVPETSKYAVDVPGRPKRQRAPRQQHVDALNGCLCGEVLQPLSNGVLKCKQAGCETQWVPNNLNQIEILLILGF
jgi:hypothetical protein